MLSWNLFLMYSFREEEKNIGSNLVEEQISKAHRSWCRQRSGCPGTFFLQKTLSVNSTRYRHQPGWRTKLLPRSSGYLLWLLCHNLMWCLTFLQGYIYSWKSNLEESFPNSLTHIIVYTASWERLLLTSDGKIGPIFIQQSKAKLFSFKWSYFREP